MAASHNAYVGPLTVLPCSVHSVLAKGGGGNVNTIHVCMKNSRRENSSYIAVGSSLLH